MIGLSICLAGFLLANNRLEQTDEMAGSASAVNAFLLLMVTGLMIVCILAGLALVAQPRISALCRRFFPPREVEYEIFL